MGPMIKFVNRFLFFEIKRWWKQKLDRLSRKHRIFFLPFLRHYSQPTVLSSLATTSGFHTSILSYRLSHPYLPPPNFPTGCCTSTHRYRLSHVHSLPPIVSPLTTENGCLTAPPTPKINHCHRLSHRFLLPPPFVKPLPTGTGFPTGVPTLATATGCLTATHNHRLPNNYPVHNVSPANYVGKPSSFANSSEFLYFV